MLQQANFAALSDESVTVDEIKVNDGSIVLALYDTAGGFLEDDYVYKYCIRKADRGEVICLLENVPAGKYAIAVYHDKNNNKELDTNWIGIPKEAYGFSNNPKIRLRPPNFTECSFTLKADKSLSIRLL